MSPIANVSDVVRMPRLGKIRLGIKVDKPGKNPYPKATDYFVCPEEVQKVEGEKPKELEIMFPVEDPSEFAPQWLRCYSLTQGLICIGNGETCRSKVDLATGEIAGHLTEQWEWRDQLPCNPEECPHYGKQCRRVMNLLFLLPQVPGLGVWQIDTSSFYSIVNINSMIKMLKGMLGRCSMVPLTLALGPIEVTPPGMRKKTVHVMHIKKDITLADLARLAQLPPGRVLLPEPEVDEPPEDLFPQPVLEQAERERAQPSPPGSFFIGPPAADEPEQPATPLDEAWDRARASMKEAKLPYERYAAYFQQVYKFSITEEELKADTPPLGMTEAMLSTFVDQIQDYLDRSSGGK